MGTGISSSIAAVGGLLCPGGLEQRVQPLVYRRRQPPDDPVEKRLLVRLGHGANQAPQPASGGWFQMLIAAPVTSCILERLRARPRVRPPGATRLSVPVHLHW